MRVIGPRGRRGGWHLTVPLADVCLLALHAYVGQVRDRLDDVRCTWNRVLEIIWDYEEQLFDNEGRTSEHPRWAELSDNPIRFHGGLGYRTWKEENYGTPLLELTGKLRSQLTGYTQGEAPFIGRERTRLTFGTNYETFAGVEYRPRSPLDRTAMNDIGGMHGEGRTRYYPMPARPPIRVTRREAFEITDAILDWVLEGEVP